MKMKLERIILWLTHSGMVVNEAKTDLCLFAKNDSPPLVININGKYIISKKVINILGVTFDSKLQWCNHIAATSNKALKALNAIRIIKKNSQKELLHLNTSNVLSILYRGRVKIKMKKEVGVKTEMKMSVGNGCRDVSCLVL